MAPSNPVPVAPKTFGPETYPKAFFYVVSSGLIKEVGDLIRRWLLVSVQIMSRNKPFKDLTV